MVQRSDKIREGSITIGTEPAVPVYRREARIRLNGNIRRENMKRIAAILLLLALGRALGQDQVAPQTQQATNITLIKSPLIFKGLYGPRSGKGRKTTETAVLAALRMFKTTQNADGSWGAGEARRLATPLVLSAFLGHGETPASEQFGTSVARAHGFVLECNPSNDAERASAILALSEYLALHVSSRERDHAAREIEKIRGLLSSIRQTGESPWVDYLTFYLLPPEVKRPEWMKYTRDFPKRWSDALVDVEPGTLDGYLALRVAGLAKFRIGGKVWGDFNRQFAPKMVEQQTAEGFYPCQSETDQYACTALAVQTMQVYYAWQPNYYARPEPEREDATVNGKDVEVRIE